MIEANFIGLRFRVRLYFTGIHRQAFFTLRTESPWMQLFRLRQLDESRRNQ